jgi:hypothetical protein
MSIRNLALAVDDAVAALDSATAAYLAEMDRLNRDRRITRPGQEPHPVYSRGRDFLLAAVSSRVELAKALGLIPRQPSITVSQNHPD